MSASYYRTYDQMYAMSPLALKIRWADLLFRLQQATAELSRSATEVELEGWSSPGFPSLGYLMRSISKCVRAMKIVADLLQWHCPGPFDAPFACRISRSVLRIVSSPAEWTEELTAHLGTGPSDNPPDYDSEEESRLYGLAVFENWGRDDFS